MTPTPLNAELNPIFRLLALLGAHRIFHVSRIRVNDVVGSTPVTYWANRHAECQRKRFLLLRVKYCMNTYTRDLSHSSCDR